MGSEISTRGDVASNIDLLSAWIESRMVYAGQPGLSIGMVYDQELVWARGFGHADVARHGFGKDQSGGSQRRQHQQVFPPSCTSVFPRGVTK